MPPALDAAAVPGALVAVPLGRRAVLGVVVGREPPTHSGSLAAIAGVVDAPVVGPDMLDLARWVAKNVVAAGFATRAEVQVAYAIGVAHPVSVNVQTFGTGTRSDDEILAWINEKFDLRPGAIIDHLDLRRPIYQKTAAYGHFGRTEPEFTWESTAIGDEQAG